MLSPCFSRNALHAEACSHPHGVANIEPGSYADRRRLHSRRRRGISNWQHHDLVPDALLLRWSRRVQWRVVGRRHKVAITGAGGQRRAPGRRRRARRRVGEQGGVGAGDWRQGLRGHDDLAVERLVQLVDDEAEDFIGVVLQVALQRQACSCAQGSNFESK